MPRPRIGAEPLTARQRFERWKERRERELRELREENERLRKALKDATDETLPATQGTKRMRRITNAAGLEIDFDAAAALMDDGIVAGLGDGNMAGLSEQQAFDAYCAAHLDKFGEEFGPNKANLVW